MTSVSSSSRHAVGMSMKSSLQLTSRQDTDASFSLGSTASGDSFVGCPGDGISEHDDDDSYDPYLGKRRPQREQIHFFTNPQKTRDHAPPTPQTAVESSSSSSFSPPISPVVAATTTATTPSPVMPSNLEIPTKASLPRGNAPAIMIARREIMDPHMRQAQHERTYWNKIAMGRVGTYGTVHVQTAESLLHLGNAHMRCQEYSEARSVFQGVARIFRNLYGNSDLRVALALHKVGLAASQITKSETALESALVALHQAFIIRHGILGPWHVDTVDTLNHMAGVYLRQNELEKALQAYFEVLTVRQAIFGKYHPSVAITSHALGGIHMRLWQMDDAFRCYHEALAVYRHLELTQENPAVARLRKDISSMERVMSCRAVL